MDVGRDQQRVPICFVIIKKKKNLKKKKLQRYLSFTEYYFVINFVPHVTTRKISLDV